ncbi:MAG: DNA mismatch repair endonuclease MutL [Bryobacteraceae bacterium]
MGRIRVLSDQVANKIAAGEVVERPASVVKELLENSLDAGATDLRIDVDSGGRRLIRVADNGGGMLRDDALLAFERHATSKLSDVKDLVRIATLGFRGEALPSVASVSRLVLETRSADEATGMRVEIAGGKLLRAEEAALTRGTTVTVRDLFYNVPARRKFLRSEETELAHIAALVTHYSLAHPDKTFVLRSGPKELLYATPAATLRDRVYQVFGERTLEELVELSPRRGELRLDPPARHEEPEETATKTFGLRGFVSRPQYQRLNRNSTFLFVNGRLIRDKLLLHAISAAYHNLLPPACHPFVLLFLECDFDEVDVNVHPSKTEVRFRHGSFVHDLVRDTIREALVESRPASSLPAPAPVTIEQDAQPAAALPFSEFSQYMERPPWPAATGGAGELPEVTIHVPSPAAAAAKTIPSAKLPDTHGEIPIGAAGEATASLEALASLRPMGQLHESFIIAAGPDGLWIVDQHVAHERILFERFLKELAAGQVEVQRLLLPVIVELTAGQQIEYQRIAEDLQAAGFETEPFGQRTIAVKGAPAGVSAGEIQKLLYEILEIAESELRGLSMADVRRAMTASIACRAAIKVNTRLDQTKMEWLLAALAKTDCPMTCPHGRPIALRYSAREILRGFHRI